MRRALSGVAVVLAAATLVGCASRLRSEGEDLVLEPDYFTVSDALGLTGVILLIPLGIAITLWIVWGFDRWNSPRSDAEKAAARVALFAAFGITAVMLLVWTAAIWTGVGT